MVMVRVCSAAVSCFFCSSSRSKYTTTKKNWGKNKYSRNVNNGDVTSTKGNDDDKKMMTKRRSILLTKAALVISEATLFPWLSELYTRPKVTFIDGEDDVPTTLKSLLPAKRNEYDVLRAKECMKTGESLISEKKYKEAIVSLLMIEQLVPREYKINQKAKLLLSECYRQIKGVSSKEYLDAKGAVWWWGRGLRWPGWYIISFLGARHVFFEAKDDKVGEFSVSEGVLIAGLGIAYLMLLTTYGLPDL